MHVVVAGASGFLGHRLLRQLSAAGHSVTQLVRSAPASADQGPSTGADQQRRRQVYWNPDRGQLDAAVLAGADAVVNLCGVGVGDKRWTAAYKVLIRSSRVLPTALLAKRCGDAGVPVLLNASAVGFYGPRGAEVVDESAPAGTSFLAGVCVDWENATLPAVAVGVRVVPMRTGYVLGSDGGLLPKLTLATKLLAGGRLGSGRQYFPWISATDEIGAMMHLLGAQVAGPVNLTGPAPVTNAEFARELGRRLHRPTPWVVPAPALRVVLGEFAAEVVAGQNAVPRALSDSGYAFAHPTLSEALAGELG